VEEEEWLMVGPEPAWSGASGRFHCL